MQKHLYISLSSHGFGHIAQTSTVINVLLEMHPKLKVTIQCGAPTKQLQQWFNCEFTHQRRITDFGMQMDNAVDVQREQSIAAYHAFHNDWQGKVDKEAEQIQTAAPDLVFSNISYLALAAAHQADIPSLALCSLNWADIYEGYCDHSATNQIILEQMCKAYQSAQHFLQPTPSMPMLWLNNRKSIAPIARLGKQSRNQLKDRLGLPRQSKLILVGLGGIPTELPIDDWPTTHNHYWLIPDSWHAKHSHAIPFATAGMSFIDLLASCDLLLTKPGYGSFAEATCNNVPIIYLPRNDWPEEPFLVDWLHNNGIGREISREQLYCGSFSGIIDELCRIEPPQTTPPCGAVQAAQVIANML